VAEAASGVAAAAWLATRPGVAGTTARVAFLVADVPETAFRFHWMGHLDASASTRDSASCRCSAGQHAPSLD